MPLLGADLWDAAVAAGKEGRAAVLEVAMDVLQSPPPPSTQARAGAPAGPVQLCCCMHAVARRLVCLVGASHHCLPPAT